MTNKENVKDFRRKFVSAAVNQEKINNAIRAKMPIPLELVDEAIADVDTMAALYPMLFEDKNGQNEDTKLYINMGDPEDEPTQSTGNVQGLSASFARIVIEDIKFHVLNVVMVYEPEKDIVEKYKPIFLQQVAWCFNHLLEKPTLGAWEQDKLVVYANQLGYYTCTGVQDESKLQRALEILEVGNRYANWHHHGYIKHTSADVLLKLGRTEEAYAIIAEGLELNDNNEYFQEYKQDPNFIQWLHASDNEKAVALRHKQKEKQELLDAIIAEEQDIFASFKHPHHPQVVEHTEALIAIKQYMLTLRKLALAKVNMNKLDRYKKNYILSTATVQDIEVFEATNGVSLPGDLKAYLLEIGTGGAYFMEGDVPSIEQLGTSEIEKLKKPFPITSDKIHDVKNFYGVKAWVYSDSNDWIEKGILPEGTDMEALFGLPQNARMDDGCISLGCSRGRNELMLVTNGEFVGQVWSDRLGYGAKAHGCFGPASAEQLTLLPFITASLRNQVVEEEDDNGDWL